MNSSSLWFTLNIIKALHDLSICTSLLRSSEPLWLSVSATYVGSVSFPCRGTLQTSTCLTGTTTVPLPCTFLLAEAMPRFSAGSSSTVVKSWPTAGVGRLSMTQRRMESWRWVMHWIKCRVILCVTILFHSCCHYYIPKVDETRIFDLLLIWSKWVIMLAVVAAKLGQPIKWNMGLAHRGESRCWSIQMQSWKPAFAWLSDESVSNLTACFAIKGNIFGFPVHVESLVACTKVIQV